MYLGPVPEQLVRQEVTRVEVLAIRRESVDFAVCIDPPNETLAIPACGVAAQRQDVAVPWQPFALHSSKPLSDLEVMS